MTLYSYELILVIRINMPLLLFYVFSFKLITGPFLLSINEFPYDITWNPFCCHHSEYVYLKYWYNGCFVKFYSVKFSIVVMSSMPISALFLGKLSIISHNDFCSSFMHVCYFYSSSFVCYLLLNSEISF